VTTTDALGRFSFDGVYATDVHNLAVKNEQWLGELDGVSVEPDKVTENVELLVGPPPAIVGHITLDGKAPEEPVVLGLGSIYDGKISAPGWNGFGISNLDGEYRAIPFYAGRRVALIPKQATSPELGGYRRFRSEFPQDPPDDWPWIAGPVWGEERFDFDVERK